MLIIFYRDGGTYVREVREVKFIPDAASPSEYKLAIDGDVVFSKMSTTQKMAIEKDFCDYLASGKAGPYSFITKDICSFGGGLVDKAPDNSTNIKTNRAKSGKRTTGA